jgi:hypothetical protein
MFVEQLIKKKEECIILGFFRGMGRFSLLGCCLFLLSLFSAGCCLVLSFFLYAKKP